MNLISCLHSAVMCTVGKPKITPHTFPALLIQPSHKNHEGRSLPLCKTSCFTAARPQKPQSFKYKLDPASFKINHNAIYYVQAPLFSQKVSFEKRKGN